MAPDAKGASYDGRCSGDVHVVESVVLNDEDAVAVGLDEVRFVDAQFLDVGARVVLPFDECLVGGPEAGHRCPAIHRAFVHGRRLQHHGAVPAAVQPVRADPLGGFELQMD